MSRKQARKALEKLAQLGARQRGLEVSVKVTFQDEVNNR